jgi:hypothetical protein
MTEVVPDGGKKTSQQSSVVTRDTPKNRYEEMGLARPKCEKNT